MIIENNVIQKELDVIIVKILNDKRIFSPLYGIELFDGRAWSDLKKCYYKKDKKSYDELIDKRNENIKRLYRNKGIKDMQIIDNICIALKNAYCKKPILLDKLFHTLKWYGPVRCNLPDLEGSIIYIWQDGLKGLERYINCEIGRARGYKRNALYALRNYISLLNIPLYCIEYLVRKINILSNYWLLIYE